MTGAAVARWRWHRAVRARPPTLVAACSVRRRLRARQLSFLRLLRRRSNVATSALDTLNAPDGSVVHLRVCAADELSAAARARVLAGAARA